MPSSSRKKIYIAYTGGTIGMQPSKQGYIPAKGFIASQMAKMPELQHSDMPSYTIKEYQPLIDSSNMTPKEWMTIARDIEKVYEEYDGFIILHGTDTMAYTASALSFLLENLNKPVIVTGSQIPLAEIRNDARQTLITALLLASHYKIPEVCLYFGHRLFRGNRARKISAQSFTAFESPNFPALIEVGIHIKENKNLWLKPTQKKLKLHTLKETSIVCLRFFPGMSANLLEHLFTTPIQALILETFGSGNAPDNQPLLLAALKKATENGVIIVNCTQCVKGNVDMTQYATGNALQAAGVISAGDMTPEAVIGKLYFLLSQNISPAKIKLQLQKNLRGELSI
jgi:L-asparaginase